MPHTQRGAALFTVVILVMIMTLLTLASVRATALEERMSASVLDRAVGFQAAEAALRIAERSIPTVVVPSSGCASGVCAALPIGQTQRWLTSAGWAAASEVDVDLGALTEHPQVLIELLATGVPAPGACLDSGDVSGSICDGTQRRFLITARSAPSLASDGRSVVLLQSIFAAK